MIAVLLFFFYFIEVSFCYNNTKIVEKIFLHSKKTSIRKRGAILPILMNGIGFGHTLFSIGKDFEKPFGNDHFKILSQDLENFRELLLKLNEEQKCSFIDFSHDNNWKLINHLFDELRNYAENTNKNVSEKAMKRTCYESLDNIYKEIKNSLKHETIIKYISKCGLYRSKSASIWSEEIEKMSFYLSFLLIGCEQIYEYKTEFKLNKFLDDTNKLIKYYNEKGFFEAFAQDKGSFGLKNLSNKNSINKEFIRHYTFPLSFQNDIQSIHNNEYVEYLNLLEKKINDLWSFVIDKILNNGWGNAQRLEKKKLVELLISPISGELSWPEIFRNKKYLNNDIRRVKHYKEHNVRPKKYSIEDCLDTCKNDTRCYACAVYYDSNRDNTWHSCYLFEKDHIINELDKNNIRSGSLNKLYFIS